MLLLVAYTDFFISIVLVLLYFVSNTMPVSIKFRRGV